HVLLRGNSYSQIIRNNAGDPIELMPLHPTRVKPEIEKETGNLVYKVRLKEGINREVTLQQSEVFHLRGYHDSGLEGTSPIAYMAEAVGLGLAMEAHSASFFGNNAAPAGTLNYPGELGDQAFEQLQKDWLDVHQGPKNAGKIAILENGLKWERVGLSAED